MVISIIGRALQVGFKYRKQIYRVLVAQDRAIDRAFRVGGYSRQTRYGARHGALAGSLIGTFLPNFAPDTPGNEFQKPFQKKQPSARKSYQTRSRRPTGFQRRNENNEYTSSRKRCARPRFT